jgi:hypothetical protein
MDDAETGGEIPVTAAQTLQKSKPLLCAIELCEHPGVAVIHKEIRHRESLPTAHGGESSAARSRPLTTAGAPTASTAAAQ